MKHCKIYGNNIPADTTTCEEAGFGEGCGNSLRKQEEKHVCCDGECNHDDCCGKIEANCPKLATSENLVGIGGSGGGHPFSTSEKENPNEKLQKMINQANIAKEAFEAVGEIPTPHESSEKEWTCPCGRLAEEFGLCGRKECEEKYTTSKKEKCGVCFEFNCTKCHCEHDSATNDECECNCHKVPLHESEDWEAKLKNLIILEEGQHASLSIEFVKKLLSKAYQRGSLEGNQNISAEEYRVADMARKEGYQRGREEGSAKKGEAKRVFYMQGYEAGLREKFQEHDAVKRDEFIAFAVQEIEKEKKKVIPNMLQDDEVYNERGMDGVKGFNSGLDKAKSIISGVMKK